MKLGIIDHAVNWTPTAGAYFAWEIACGIFVTIPFVTFTVLSGLQSIDASYYEAAAVDGASYWQKMFQIIIFTAETYQKHASCVGMPNDTGQDILRDREVIP